MIVMVRRDSATNTPVDLGDGPDAEAKLRKLVEMHGASVTNEDGSPFELPAEPVEEAPAPKKSKRKKGDD